MKVPMAPQVWHCTLLVLLLFSNNFPSFVTSCPSDNSLYLIRSTASSLVVDAGDGRLILQYFDGYTPQLWRFKMGNRPGLFYIISEATGKVLDVDKNNGDRVVLAQENNSLEQQWYLNSNGRIVNAGYKKNLDVRGGKYVPGNPLRLWAENGDPAQDFLIKERLTCCPSSCTNATGVTDPRVN